MLNVRDVLDPEFCYLPGSGSMPDPDMLDLAGSGSEPDPNHLDLAGSGSIRIWIQTFLKRSGLDYCRHQEKNYSFCATTGRNWNDCLPCFVTELLLEWWVTLTVLNWNDWVSEFLYTVLCCHVSFPGMKKCCDVLCHSYVHLASIYALYLANDLIRVADMPSRHRLRSARTHQLEVPRVRLATISGRTFRAAGSRLWNSLPSDVVDCQTVDTFRRPLKHFFINVSFSWH